MTRNDFLDNITTWLELIEFCSEEGCSVCEDIVDDDGKDEEIENDLADVIRDYNWREIRDMLNDIGSGYDYYRRDGMFDYVGMDNDYDFSEYRDAVLEWMDDEEAWDEEEDDTDVFAEELDAAMEKEEEGPVEDEDFPVDALIGMCSVTFVAIQKENTQRLQEDERAIGALVNVNIPKPIR